MRGLRLGSCAHSGIQSLPSGATQVIAKTFWPARTDFAAKSATRLAMRAVALLHSHESQTEGGFRMVPVANRRGFRHHQQRRRDRRPIWSGFRSVDLTICQLGQSRPIVRLLLFFREGRPPNRQRWVIYIWVRRAPARNGDRRRPQAFCTLQNAPVERDVEQDIYLLGRRFLLEELIGVFLKDILPAGIGDLPAVCGHVPWFSRESGQTKALAIEWLANAYRKRRRGACRVRVRAARALAYWYARVRSGDRRPCSWFPISAAARATSRLCASTQAERGCRPRPLS